MSARYSIENTLRRRGVVDRPQYICDGAGYIRTRSVGTLKDVLAYLATSKGLLFAEMLVPCDDTKAEKAADACIRPKHGINH